MIKTAIGLKRAVNKEFKGSNLSYKSIAFNIFMKGQCTIDSFADYKSKYYDIDVKSSSSKEALTIKSFLSNDFLVKVKADTYGIPSDIVKRQAEIYLNYGLDS